MPVLAASAGSFPRSDAAESKLLWQVINDQIECGLDVVTDGQLRWRDPVSHFAGQLTGVELGAQGRFLDTGVPIRRPVIRGPFAWAVPVLRPEFEAAQAVSPKPVKPVLTGALSLARHSIVLDPYYARDFARLVGDYNEALLCEVRELAAAGATIIQIDEPAILQSPQQPEDLRILKHCWRRLSSAKGHAKLALNLCGGDSAPILEELFRVPADVLVLDLTCNPRLVEMLAYAQPGQSVKSFGLAMIDGCKAALEDSSAIARSVEKLARSLGDGDLYLSATTGLGGLGDLTRDEARAKLKLLAEIRDLLCGVAVLNSIST